MRFRSFYLNLLGQEKGQALVEMAILLPLFLFLLWFALKWQKWQVRSFHALLEQRRQVWSGEGSTEWQPVSGSAASGFARLWEAQFLQPNQLLGNQAGVLSNRVTVTPAAGEGPDPEWGTDFIWQQEYTLTMANGSGSLPLSATSSSYKRTWDYLANRHLPGPGQAFFRSYVHTK